MWEKTRKAAFSNSEIGSNSKFIAKHGKVLLFSLLPGAFMKKWLFLLAICLCSLSFASPIQDHKIDPAALSQLGRALDIPQDADIVLETQKRWLRRPNQERWEIAELSLDQRLFVLNWATDQGLFAPWKPASKGYDKALILGATTSRMQIRLDYLKQLWNEG